LAADMSRGNRPGFSYAAKPEHGKLLYEYFAEQLQSAGVPVATGSFGADMKVRLLNDGPATFWLDTEQT
jgi:D-tyrosyl-tRNA(Tyr) deacylase